MIISFLTAGYVGDGVRDCVSDSISGDQFPWYVMKWKDIYIYIYPE